MYTGKNLVLPVTPKYAKETFEFIMWMNKKMTTVQQKIRKEGDWNKKQYPVQEFTYMRTDRQWQRKLIYIICTGTE